MKNKKIILKLCGCIFLVLLMSFMTLYFSQLTGYYEYTEHKKVVFTSEQIKKFEQDILDGKDVTLEDYLTDQTKNYNNRISKFGNYLSVTIGDYVKQGLENTFEAIEKWIEE